MTDPLSSGRPRFLAYDLTSGRLVMTGMEAHQILNSIRDFPWPSVHEQSVEIFDCGPDGVDADAVRLTADGARARFAAVYRGTGVPGLPPIALSIDS